MLLLLRWYVLITNDLLIHCDPWQIPAEFSYEAVATIPVGLTAAYVGLYNMRPFGLGLSKPTESKNQGMYTDKPMVVLGGSSSVGQFGK